VRVVDRPTAENVLQCHCCITARKNTNRALRRRQGREGQPDNRNSRLRI
jgi:hypothetical protein